VTSFLGAPGNERRGRAKRFFRVTAPGVSALRASLGSLDRMRQGVDGLDRLVGVTP
jgi:hypothetical protein